MLRLESFDFFHLYQILYSIICVTQYLIYVKFIACGARHQLIHLLEGGIKELELHKKF